MLGDDRYTNCARSLEVMDHGLINSDCLDMPVNDNQDGGIKPETRKLLYESSMEIDFHGSLVPELLQIAHRAYDAVAWLGHYGA